MRFVLDIHLHSSHSRATSRDLTPENLHRWSALKGLTVVGTGDFTHPAWIEELKTKLSPAEEGLYRLKPAYRTPVEKDLPASCRGEVRFLLSVEISSIYKKNGRTRKVHNLVLMPDFTSVERLNRRLGEIGNLKSDGRPILGLDSRDLVEIALEACPEALFIPAHIWTPHFAMFGANSGFDSFEECFEDMMPHIFAVETGLSSDPPMNWRLSVLDNFAIVSNSDAHSPPKLAREATCFDTDLSYPAIRSALKGRDPARFTGTLEFYPEEGKYHCDGHRACGVRWRPAETRAAGGACSVCGRPVTVGVLHRVEALADRPEGARPEAARPYENLIPLTEIIASAKGIGPVSQKAQETYYALLHALGPELKVLREAPVEEIDRCGGPLVAEGVRRMRAGEVEIAPGFDGEYGRIRVFREGEREQVAGQGDMFGRRKGTAENAKGAKKGRGEGEQPSPRLASLGFPSPTCGRGVANNVSQGEGLICDPRPVTQDSGLRIGGQEERGGTVLTPEQEAAVRAEEGPVVVAAGPGTGKTLVLTLRAVRLIREHGVPAQAIMAVTFTNRAAHEMLRRVRDMLPELREVGVRVGTFHRMALDLLREHGGGEERTLIDEIEARSIVEAVLREGKYQIRLSDACDAISRAKGGNTLRDALQGSSEVGSMMREYQNRLRMLRLRDYDDILLDAVALLESDAGVLEEVRRVHLMVDEFQDVNAVQYRFVRLIAGAGRNLFVIGDPDQAIYGFRGADPRHFRQLLEDFPGARLIRLEVNHRSTGAILGAAHAVIEAEPGRLGLALRATRETGVRVRLLAVESDVAEGIAVAQEIVRQVGGTDLIGASSRTGRSFGDFAVLFRTGRQADAVEACLQKEGLPCRVVGQKGFLDAAPVRDALTFLRCALRPEDDYRLLCALRSFGPGAGALKAAQARQAEAGGALVDALRSVSQSRGGEGVRGFLEAVERFHDLARTGRPEQVVGAWREAFGVSEDPDVGRLLEVCGRYDTVEEMMRDVLLGQEADCERWGRAALRGEAVTLMTLHAAKGLEFPVVFIVGAEDGLIPFRDADLSEERRLLYVGITRGRDEVILTAVRRRVRYGRQVACEVSPFLRDLCGSLIEVEQQTRRPRRGEEQLSLF